MAFLNIALKSTCSMFDRYLIILSGIRSLLRLVPTTAMPGANVFVLCFLRPLKALEFELAASVALAAVTAERPSPLTL